MHGATMKKDFVHYVG